MYSKVFIGYCLSGQGKTAAIIGRRRFNQSQRSSALLCLYQVTNRVVPT